VRGAGKKKGRAVVEEKKDLLEDMERGAANASVMMSQGGGRNSKRTKSFYVQGVRGHPQRTWPKRHKKFGSTRRTNGVVHSKFTLGGKKQGYSFEGVLGRMHHRQESYLDVPDKTRAAFSEQQRGGPCAS